MLRTWLKSRLKAKHHNSPKRDRHAKLSFEHLETKSLLTTLVVDINDPTADQPGDNLYAQIQEAVDAAEEGDVIKVHSGTYERFRVGVPNITIREARWNSNPVIDNQDAGDDPGIWILENGVTIQGLIVNNRVNSPRPRYDGNVAISVARGGAKLIGNTTYGGGTGFSIAGLNVHLIGNTAFESARYGFLIGFAENSLFLRNSSIGSGWAGFQLNNGRDNTLLLNSAEQGGSGFVIFGMKNLLTRNVATDNQVGFLIRGWENNLHRNIATDNILGFAISERGYSTRLIGNIAKNNEMEGFRVGSTDNTVRGNWAINNGGEGFDVNTEDNTLGRNWVYTEEEGLMPFGSNENHSRSRGIWSRLVDAVMDSDGERESLFGRRSRRFGRA